MINIFDHEVYLNQQLDPVFKKEPYHITESFDITNAESFSVRC
jgi:hypothetical protein